jgi:hypothetical protein
MISGSDSGLGIGSLSIIFYLLSYKGNAPRFLVRDGFGYYLFVSAVRLLIAIVVTAVAARIPSRNRQSADG